MSTERAGARSSAGSQPALSVRDVSKTFILHTQGAIQIPVLSGIELSVNSGECLCLTGSSGAGKSTLLRSLYGSSKLDSGEIIVQHDGAPVDLLSAPLWQTLEIRRRTIGYVSQFLRVIPRVSTIDIITEPAIQNGATEEQARARAERILNRLQIPERLWSLSPLTFSGGEQQRVNIARSLILDYPVLLLDEPTASLDAGNRQTVLDLIAEAKRRGSAVIAIFHDSCERDAIADRLIEVGRIISPA